MTCPFAPKLWLCFLFAIAGAFGLLALLPQTAAAQSPIFVDDSTDDGLITYFKFDEGFGTSVRDWIDPATLALIGPGTNFSALTPAQLSVPNFTSMQLDGATNLVTVTVPATSPINSLTTDFSVTAWIQRSATNQTPDTVWTNGAMPNGWHLSIIAGAGGQQSLAFRINIGAASSIYTTTVTASPMLVNTDWHHVAATLGGGALKLYIDGLEQGSFTGVTVPAQSGDKYIGSLRQAGGSSVNRFPGRIDELRLYDRALTAAEIARLASGSGCSTDGFSWATALRDLHCATAQVSTGGEVRVAAGVYKPGQRNHISFIVPTDMRLLGGFLGVSAANPDDRPSFDPAAPLTILSGDILGNDVPNEFAGITENTRTVLVAFGYTISATVDGFGIERGNALGSFVGGGMRVEGPGTLTVNNVSFHRNFTNANGGAIHATAPLLISNSYFESNVALDDGGAIHVSSPMTVTASRFYSSTAVTGNGGAILSQASIVLAGLPGPLVPSLSIRDSEFVGNEAPDTDAGQGRGGALLARGNVALLQNNLWRDNFAGTLGGAVSSDFVLDVTEDRFLGNDVDVSAFASGGAIGTFGGITVTRTIFAENVAHSGGAIAATQAFDASLFSSVVTVANSLFFDNERVAASAPSELLLQGKQALVINSTFAGSSSPAPALAAHSSALTVTNSIFANYGSLALYASGLALGPSQEDFNLYFNSTLDPSITSGGNSVTGDPLFVNEAANDYRLLPASPAIDRGHDAAALADGLATDLLGLPRLVDGNPARTPLVDMGALEFQWLHPTAVPGGPYTAQEGAPMALVASASAGTPPLTFAWDCTNNGSIDVSGSAPTGLTCLYPDNGAVTLRLRLSDELGFISVATTPVTVQNVAPIVTPAATQNATPGQQKLFSLGVFADPGALDGPWTVSVNWGDGTQASTFQATGTGVLPATNHTFEAPGTRTVTISVTDKDGGVGTASFAVNAGGGAFNIYVPTVFGQ